MSLFSNFLIGILMFASCSHLNKDNPGQKEKKAPQYQGVDPSLQHYVNDYIDLSHEKHIYFDKTVTVGFAKLGYPESAKDTSRVIGVCTMAENWHEIDIDQDFWNRANEAQRYTLIFHELTHCYCGRFHDYGKDQYYSDDDSSRAIKDFMFAFFKKRPGFLDDDCPMSIMYPVVLDEQCFKDHLKEYLDEMFDRCIPW